MTADRPQSNFTRIFRVFGELADGLKALIPSAKILELDAAERRRILASGFASSNAEKLQVWGDYISTLHMLADDSPQKDDLYVEFARKIKELQDAK